MNNTIQLYMDENEEIQGYPITSPDRVIDENGITIKEQLDNNMCYIKDIFLNIKMFGAKGDGVTDDTISIINALKIISSNGGGTLYFPQGCYIFRGVRIGKFTDITNNGNIAVIPNINNITIKGEKQENTIIKLKETSNSDIFVFRFINNITFNNICLDGNKNQNNNLNAYWNGIGSCNLLIRDCNNVKIEYCSFINSEHFGANISSNSRNILINNNNFDNCKTGLDVACQMAIIENNTITNCTVAGLFLEGNNYEIDYTTYKNTNYLINVSNNNISKCSGSGIILKNVCSIVNIINNIILDCSAHGIICDASSTTSKNIGYLYINGNKIFNITDKGILLNTVYDSNISCNIIRNTNTGLYVTKCKNLCVKDNIISESVKNGAVLYNNNNYIIFNCNRILNSSILGVTSQEKSAIYIGSGNDKIIIKENFVIDNREIKIQEYGLIMENNPTNIYISDNIFEGNKIKDILDKSGSATFSSVFNIGSNLPNTKLPLNFPILKGSFNSKPLLSSNDVGLYLETSSNKLIIWNGTKWIDLDGLDLVYK